MMTYAKTKIAAALLAAAILAGTGGVIALTRAVAQNTPAKAGLPKAAGGVTVETAPPVVVKTVPQAGDDQVDPNLTEIKVTFSKDMADGSWSWAQMSKESFPGAPNSKPHYEDDHRTCVLPAKLEPGKTYVVLLNKAPYTSFMDTDHRQALEYWLVFKTKP
jgi:RNA polymerase sigma-70 factor (ECF subfamily)